MIAAIAGRQFGVVARTQLLQAGVTPEHIRTPLAARRLRELHRGIYLVGAVRPEHAHEMAALLACGEIPSVAVHGRRLSLSRPDTPTAILSHRSAAHLWDLLLYPASEDVCITTAHGRGARRRGIEAHRAILDRRDIRRRHAMSVTSPPRTILEMAATLGSDDPTTNPDPVSPHRLDGLEQLVAQAQYRRRATEAELRDQLERNPGKRGVRALRGTRPPGRPEAHHLARRARAPATAQRALDRRLRRQRQGRGL